jgi:hypothetical protein
MKLQSNRAGRARAMFAAAKIILVSVAAIAAAASIYVFAAAPAARAALNGVAAAAHPAAASLMVPDKGKFRILSGGKEVGKEEYEIAPSGENWIARGTSEIQSEKGPAQHVTGKLELHDWKKMGPQIFSVLVPQDLAPGVVTVESLGKHDAGGQKLEELRVKTDDNEIDLFLDGPRLVRISAPAANAEIIRE